MCVSFAIKTILLTIKETCLLLWLILVWLKTNTWRPNTINSKKNSSSVLFCPLRAVSVQIQQSCSVRCGFRSDSNQNSRPGFGGISFNSVSSTLNNIGCRCVPVSSRDSLQIQFNSTWSSVRYKGDYTFTLNSNSWVISQLSYGDKFLSTVIGIIVSSNYTYIHYTGLYNSVFQLRLFL